MAEESIIGKFFGVLGLKVDHAGLDEFQGSLNHIKHAVEAVFAVEIIKHVAEFVERSIGAAAAINDLSEVTETSTEKIDALGRVAVENSSSVEAMNGAIIGVYRATGQAALGIGRNVKLFQTLGIHAKDASGHVKSADEVMTDLAAKFQTMDMAKVVGVASRLGIDPMIARAMKEAGREGWQAQVKAAMSKGILSASDYREADATEKAFKRFHLVIGQVSALVANQLAPWLRRAIDAFEKFVVSNKVALVAKLHAVMKQVANVLAVLWDWGSRLGKAVGDLYGKMEKTSRAGEAFRLVLVAIAAVGAAQTVNKVATAVNNMWTAFTKVPKLLGVFSLLVVAVGLLVEDWLGFQRGEDSVIGDLEKRWPAAFEVISTAMRGLLAIWDGIVEAARALGIVKKPEAPKMSLARYKQFQDNPPKEGTPEAEEFLAMERVWKSGQHPMQQFAGGVEAASAVPFALAAAMRNKDNAVDATASGIGAILADVEAKRGAAGTTVYVTGTKVEVKADTPARAQQAGASVRDALAMQKIRNYQPRTE